MAHVTTFRFKASPGKRDAVIEQFRRWEAEAKPGAVGFQGSILVGSNHDPEEITAVVTWDTTENYNKNSDRPETNAWYQGLRANLVADPEWFDGTLVLESKP